MTHHAHAPRAHEDAAVFGPLDLTHYARPAVSGKQAEAARATSAAMNRPQGSRGMAALLLAAIVASMLVVASQVIDTWTDGHLLAAWMGLWLVAFAALAMLAHPVRRASKAVGAAYQAWMQASREAVEEERSWAAARKSARLVADLKRMSEAGESRQLRRYY
ncbi:MAG: hypothetical protein QM740_05485 [Acidovorax sp.]